MNLKLVTLVFLEASRLSAAAYSPSFGSRFLVAGSSEPGFADGNFIESAFQGPSGLALSADGKKLYVADSGNGAIRVVDLIKRNEVSTLCKGLTQPRDLALNGDGSALYVSDQGGLSKLELPAGRVSVAYKASGVAGVSSLAWDQAGKRLLFVESTAKQLVSIDRSATPKVLGQDEILAAPGLRLACSDGVFVFDPASGTAYRAALGASALELKAWPQRVLEGQGFVAGLNADGQPRLVLWDGLGGLFKLLHPGDGAVDDFLLYDQRGNLLSAPNASKPSRWAFLHRLSDPVVRPLARLCQAIEAWCRASYDALTRADGPKRTLKVINKLLKLWARLDYAVTDEAKLNRLNLRRDRPLYAGPVSLCFDPLRHLVYVAEKDSHRILALKLVPLDSKNPDGFYDLNDPVEKAPGITRILILGDSLAVQGGRGEVMQDHRQFSKAFELYLNSLNAMHGTGKRYEVLLYAQGGVSYRGSPLSKLLGFEALLDKYKVDEVVLGLSHATMVYEGMAWSRGATVDDLSSEDVDLGFMQLPDDEKEAGLGPLGREFLSYLRQHRDHWKSWYGSWPYADGNDTAYQIPLADPTIKALILKKLDYVLAKDKQRMDAKKIKLSVILEPYKVFIAGGEMQGGGYETGPSTAPAVFNKPFQALAAKRGVTVYDPLAMMRLMDPALFPLYGYGDPHWLPATHQWFAWMMAQQYCYGDR